MAEAAIRAALDAGHDAVAWAVRDAGDGRAVGRTFTGHGSVRTLVRFANDRDECTSEVLPLFGMWDRVAGGAKVNELGRPCRDFLYWQATARQETADGRLVCASARDLRGMSAALLSRASYSDGRAFGERATKLLLDTSIKGVRARAEKAARLIGEDAQRPNIDIRTLAAGALAEYFDAKAATDGAVPLIEWAVVEVDLASGNETTLARSSPGGQKSRRGRLHDAVLKALEEEAFGHGAHSPRSNKTFVAFPEDGTLPTPNRRDAAAGRSDVRWDESTENDFSAEAINRVALSDLLARAALSPREREVFELRHGAGLKLKEIADRLGVAEGTVKSLISRARAKFDEAAGM